MIYRSLYSLIGRRILLLSPHADDVVYAIGGIIILLSRKTELQLVTVFGSSGWALGDGLTPFRTAEISARRKLEDREYCEKRGISYQCLPHPDSAVVGYDCVTELDGDVDRDPRSSHVISDIAHMVDVYVPDVVLAPCGIGGHIDHQIVRLAADALTDVKVLYYEDIPYASHYPVSKFESELIGQQLVPALSIDIGNVLFAKCSDMMIYKSQTDIDAVSGMLTHSARLDGDGCSNHERLWCRSSLNW